MNKTGKGTKPKILIVDDEAEILLSLTDLLRRDFDVLTTTNSFEAIDIVHSSKQICIVICDQRMPKMSGSKLLSRIYQIEPRIARILLTGYSDIDAVIDSVNLGKITRYIEKPWDSQNLLAILKPLAEYQLQLYTQQELIHRLSADTTQNTTGRQGQAVHETPADSEGKQQNSMTQLLAENAVLQQAYKELESSYWHIKKIQEVLPICLSCGKVKNKDADWQDVVSFLKENTRFLSHGYCPECAQKYMNQIKEDSHEKP